MRNPNSLAAQILRAKYFRDQEFLRAPIKSGCSHIWRSIGWGRSLLARGLRWNIGDGADVKVFSDKWLPRPSTFRTITSNPNSDLRVEELMDGLHRCWDPAKLNQHMLPIDREVVSSIPIGWNGGRDTLCWHYTKDGCYNVRSGYDLALKDKFQDSCSDSSAIRKWWADLWKLNVPPKVRILIWCFCQNAIPSLVNLWKRNLVKSPMCPLFKDKAETTDHALFWCGEARKVWGWSRFDCFLARLDSIPTMDLLLKCRARFNLADLSSFCMICWAIWENRNSIVNTGNARSPELVAARAENLLSEFLSASSALHSPSALPSEDSGSRDWIPPPPGQLKLNTGMQFCRKSKLTAFGAAIRDDKGKVLVAKAHNLWGSYRIDTGNFLVLREGLKLAKLYNIPVKIVEVDSLYVVSILNSSSVFLGEDIKILLNEVGGSLGQATPKSRNSLALDLASLALSSSKEYLWLDNSISCTLLS